MSATEIQSYVLALPQTKEAAHWGKPSYRVNNKIFAVLQEDGVTLTIKTVGDDRFIYTEVNPEVYRLPDTFTNLNYMHVHLPLADPDELKALLFKAWTSVAPKKLVKQLASQGGDNELCLESPLQNRVKSIIMDRDKHNDTFFECE